MRYFDLTFILMMMALFACQENKKSAILFCESIDSLGNCVGEAIHFPKEQRVFVKFESNQPFQTHRLKGTLYVIQAGQKSYLASKIFEVSPDDTELDYFLPFDQFKRAGYYQVEFTNEQGEVLDSANVDLE